MCDVAERLEKMGIAKGIELGRKEGKAEEKKASRVEFILRVLEMKGTVDEKTRKRIEEERKKYQIETLSKREIELKESLNEYLEDEDFRKMIEDLL